MDSIAKLLEIIVGFFTLFAGLVTAIWVYANYVLQRGFLPPVRFYVTGKKLGTVGNQIILNIKFRHHSKSERQRISA